MPPATTRTAALTGIDAHLIEVTADIASGLPATILTGLPDTALREARDRVHAAIVNSAEPWPQTKITVALSPASLPKRGSAYDLAIAIAILTASGAVPEPRGEGTVLFLSELGLDGRLRPVPGVLPAVAAAAAHGISAVVVAAPNAAEASQVPDVRVVPAATLADVTAWLRGGPEPPHDGPVPAQDGGPRPAHLCADFADVRGQRTALLAAEICAAGGHNMSLLGPPGAGAVMVAERLPTILPDLARDASLEVTALYSAAGQLPAQGIITRPPFRAPHHTASMAAMLGGGAGPIRPGEVPLAHRGVLFLDSAPEYSRETLDALRQPLATGEVVISRACTTARFPARFSLVLAASPCPCGAVGRPPDQCSCSPAARRRYLARLSGPLMDAIDLKARMALPRDGEDPGEPSAVILGRVAAARERAARRLHGTAWRVNSEIPSTVLRRAFPLSLDARAPLDDAISLGSVSEHAAWRAVRVAWTIADLAGRDRPTRDDSELALAFSTGAMP
jgi:magnesium chelatase family protein